MSATVRIEREDGWALVRIAREEKRNALDRATRGALAAAFAALRGQVRAIVLTGTGRSFCAGLDLAERAAEIAAGRLDTAGEEAIALNMAMRAHPAVFIAAVNGAALGGGFTLVNCCDLAIAADTAAIGCPELGFGAYASMAAPTMQMMLPAKRAAWAVLTAERLDAATAERWGLVNEVVPAAMLMPRAQALAARIAGFDPIAIDETKKALTRMPAALADWRGAMQDGQRVNAAIRRRQMQETSP